jgi:hypothetical protein
MVYLDADATMREYTDKEGNPRTGLSVSQRMYISLWVGKWTMVDAVWGVIGSIEVLKRGHREGGEDAEH